MLLSHRANVPDEPAWSPEKPDDAVAEIPNMGFVDCEPVKRALLKITRPDEAVEKCVPCFCPMCKDDTVDFDITAQSLFDL